MHIAFQIVKNNYICTFRRFFLSLCCSKHSLKRSFICTTLMTKFLKSWSHDFGPESQISAPNEGPNRRRWTLRCSSAETLRGCRQPIIRTLFTAQLREPLPKNNLHQKVFSSALLGIMELIMKNCHDTGCFLLQRPQHTWNLFDSG